MDPSVRVHDSVRALPAFAALSDDDRTRLGLHLADLTRRVGWEGAEGVDLTDEMVNVTASHAALLIAGFEPSEAPFHNVASVIFHAGTIVSRVERPGPATGVLTNAPRHLAGQSGHNRDPILLDWRTASHQIARPDQGQNVILHEFAHKLDMLDGIVDGMPPLANRAAREAWIQTLGTNFRRLRRRGPDGLVRAYGATSPASTSPSRPNCSSPVRTISPDGSLVCTTGSPVSIDRIPQRRTPLGPRRPDTSTLAAVQGGLP